MTNYNLTQTGAEVQAILDSVASFDSAPTSGSTKPVTSGGIYAAVAEGNTNDLILTEAEAYLNSRIDALVAIIDKFGEAEGERVSCRYMPKVANGEMIISGSGAPTETPRFVGQFYVDTTTPALYCAKAVTDSTADWFQV